MNAPLCPMTIHLSKPKPCAGPGKCAAFITLPAPSKAPAPKTGEPPADPFAGGKATNGRCGMANGADPFIVSR